MSARNRLQRVCLFSLAATTLCAVSVVQAQPRDTASAAAANDMAMPDDMGKPLEGVIPVRPSPPSTGVMTVDTPIGEIASDPRGRAVLQKDLPGLCERPEFIMFKGMSLPQLQPMSRGQMSKADIDQVKADLAVEKIALVAPRKTHNPIMVGRRAVGRMTHAIYHRVVLVVASL